MVFGARLHVVHVAWPDERGLTTLFARLRADLGSTVPVVIATLRGDAAEEIVAALDTPVRRMRHDDPCRTHIRGQAIYADPIDDLRPRGAPRP